MGARVRPPKSCQRQSLQLPSPTTAREEHRPARHRQKYARYLSFSRSITVTRSPSARYPTICCTLPILAQPLGISREKSPHQLQYLHILTISSFEQPQESKLVLLHIQHPECQLYRFSYALSIPSIHLSSFAHKHITRGFGIVHSCFAGRLLFRLVWCCLRRSAMSGSSCKNG